MNPFWILLDNQSTVNVFYNTTFLQNIQKVDKKKVYLYANTVMSTINKVEDLPGFGPVRLHRDGFTNILSLQSVKSKGFQVDYNSTKEDAFVVTKQNGTMRKFRTSPNGLYYFDLLEEFQQGRKVQFAEET